MLLNRLVGSFRLTERRHESLKRFVWGQRQSLGVHLTQLRQALVPKLRVPCVVIAMRTEPELDVEFRNGRHPATHELKDPHLNPLIVTDAFRGLINAEATGNFSTVPWREWGSRLLWICHVLISLSAIEFVSGVELDR